VPGFDTLRVFYLRLWKGKSPFLADRNHIHHRLLDLNLSHMQATGMLILVTLISLALAFVLADFGTGLSLVIISAFILLFNLVIGRMLAWKANKFQNSNSYPDENMAELEKLLSHETAKGKNTMHEKNGDAKVITLKSPKKASELV
jgi:hypothetical protein